MPLASGITIAAYAVDATSMATIVMRMLFSRNDMPTPCPKSLTGGDCQRFWTASTARDRAGEGVLSPYTPLPDVCEAVFATGIGRIPRRCRGLRAPTGRARAVGPVHPRPAGTAYRAGQVAVTCGASTWPATTLASFVTAMSMRRGLAFSATGIVTVSTPFSYVAEMPSVSMPSPRESWRM